MNRHYNHSVGRPFNRHRDLGLIRHYRLVQRPVGDYQPPTPVLVEDREVIYDELCFAEQKLVQLRACPQSNLIYEIEITQNRATFDADHRPLKANEQRGESDE